MINGQLFVSGNWTDGSGPEFTSSNPTTDAPLWRGSSANDADVDKAVLAARGAFKQWGRTPIDARVSIIKRYQEILNSEKDEIAALISSETGKPVWEALTEAGAMIGKIDLSIKSFDERTGERNSEIAGATARLRHKPHGVVAVFGPFNFPAHLPNGHIVPALMAGNTVVFKPSELTPAVGEHMVRCWQEAGLPNGVLNLVQGSVSTGIALSCHENLDGLFFTGSSRTGALLHNEFGGQPGKVLALEMGGNNPLIVTQVADIKGAVYHTLQSAFITAGQRCTCARRLIIPKGSSGDEFLKTLISATKKIKVGPQEDGSTPFIGSVISNESADSLLRAQERLLSKGGNSLVEMSRLHADKPFLQPGIIDVTAVKDLPDEEYFGPLLQVIRATDFEDAIEIANQTRFGLSAGIFTDVEAEYEHFLSQSRAGIVNWNRPLTGASGAAPFGGIGASGNHRPSAFYAADYCAYPVASIEAKLASLPKILSPGIEL